MADSLRHRSFFNGKDNKRNVRDQVKKKSIQSDLEEKYVLIYQVVRTSYVLRIDRRLLLEVTK